MKLSLILSTLLIGLSFILSGCASDSAEEPVISGELSSEGTSVNNVDNAIASMDSLNLETDSLSSALTDIKPTLGTSDSDEIALCAVIEIVEILDSDLVSNLIQQDSGLTNLDFINGDMDAMVTMASTASVAGGTDVMHELAVRLFDATQKIEIAFSNPEKIITTKDFNITQNDMMLVQGQALLAASQLEFIASYNYGDISFFEVQEKSINGVSYEYFEGEIDPLSLIQQSTFFKMQDTSRLLNARKYLVEGLRNTIKYESEDLSTDEDLLSEGQRLLDALNGNGIYTDLEIPTDFVNVNKLYSTTDYIDRADLIIPSDYTLNGVATPLDKDSSIIAGVSLSSTQLFLDLHIEKAESYTEVISISED